MFTIQDIYDMGLHKGTHLEKVECLANILNYLDEKYQLQEAINNNSYIIIEQQEVHEIQEKYFYKFNNCSWWKDYVNNYSRLKGLDNCIKIKEKLEQELKYKKEKERAEKEKIQEEQKIVEEYKQLYGDNFRTKKWVEENIGEYYNWEDIIAVYWTILDNENAWKKADWKDNIKLKKGYHKKLKAINKTNYLNRNFVNKKGYSSYILEEEYQFSDASSYGIYGIYKNGSLLYVGMTMREFEERWNEHKENIEKGSKQLAVYNMINLEDDIEFVKLIDVAKLETNDKITERDVKSMELATIALLEPEGNLAGRICEYKY